MKSRWSALAVLSVLPFGAALADYADLSRNTASSAPQRSVEHEALIETAEQALTSATRTARELAVAIENARRNQDVLLATCLGDAAEAVREAQADAIENLAAMNATRSVGQASALVPEINRTNQVLNSSLQNASRCEGDEEGEGGVVVIVDEAGGSTFDPGGLGPDSNPSISDPAEPPPVVVPPAEPPVIDVMEPGTDMPPVPPTASPMR